MSFHVESLYSLRSRLFRTLEIVTNEVRVAFEEIII
jgi:hypothetical protein